DVYSTGGVTANGGLWIGGSVGQLDAADIFTNSWTSSRVVAAGATAVGGLVGVKFGSFSSGSIYWDPDATGQVQNSGSIQSTFAVEVYSTAGSSAFQTASYPTFSIATSQTSNATWYLIPGYTRPFLQWEYSTNIINAHQLQLAQMNTAGS